MLPRISLLAFAVVTRRRMRLPKPATQVMIYLTRRG
jgi:hypothetical protein